MYQYENIRRVHLELTSKCNAGCPMCARYQNDSNDGETLNPHLDLTELRLEDIQEVFPVDFVERLDEIKICGNYGDAVMAHDTLEICQWFRSINPTLQISVWTNASARKASWWAELAETLGDEGYVVFSIDGLWDTNHIYRRKTTWKKIMESAKAFIEAGGHARWMFIVFQHNEHQVEMARAIAKSMGFEEFIIKKSRRFQVKETVHESATSFEIKPPTKTKYTSDALKVAEVIKRIHGSYEQFENETRIECVAIKRQEIYVSASGHVFPCCWLGIHEWDGTNRFPDLTPIDAKARHMRAILHDPFFSDIQASWDSDNRIPTCSTNCGQIFRTTRRKVHERLTDD